MQKTCSQIFTAASFIISLIWKQTERPSTGLMDKPIVIQAYNRKQLTNKKEQTTNAHKNMDESQAIILSKEARHRRVHRH